MSDDTICICGGGATRFHSFDCPLCGPDSPAAAPAPQAELSQRIWTPGMGNEPPVTGTNSSTQVATPEWPCFEDWDGAPIMCKHEKCRTKGLVEAAAPAPQAEGECPTCGSSAKAKRECLAPECPHPYVDHDYCNDAWHTGAAPAETARLEPNHHWKWFREYGQANCIHKHQEWHKSSPESCRPCDYARQTALAYVATGETAGEITPPSYKDWLVQQLEDNPAYMVTTEDEAERAEAYAKHRVEPERNRADANFDQVEELKGELGEMREKVSDLERERGEAKADAEEESRKGGMLDKIIDEQELKLKDSEAQVEQLCGDVKAMQKDYSEAVAKLEKMREAICNIGNIIGRPVMHYAPSSAMKEFGGIRKEIFAIIAQVLGE